jgi:hypothetical protein
VKRSITNKVRTVQSGYKKLYVTVEPRPPEPLKLPGPVKLPGLKRNAKSATAESTSSTESGTEQRQKKTTTTKRPRRQVRLIEGTPSTKDATTDNTNK